MNKIPFGLKSVQANRDLYNEWSEFYDEYSNPTIAIDELSFKSLWGDRLNEQVLEVGCGTGRNTQKLLRAGHFVLALDISPGMLLQAKEKILSKNVTWIETDFLSFNIPRHDYDFAICSLVLEHIDQLDLFFNKVSSTLKPEGFFYLSEIHPSRTAEGVMAHFKNAEGEDIHLVSFAHTEDGIRGAAERAGLAVNKCITCLGDERLTALNPKWKKHEGRPMIQIWEFQKKLY